MPDLQTWRRNLFRAIEEAGLLRQARRIELENGAQALVGRLEVEGRSVEIAINIDPLWHNRLPLFILRPLDALGYIPHIDPEGVICFLEEEGIIFDRNRPLDVVQECLLHVQRTLQAGATGRNRQDFVNEFEVYWARLDSPLLALSNLELADPEQVAEVFVGSSPNARAILRITHDAAQIPHVSIASSEYGPWSAFPALYLPLEPGTMLLPPQSEKPFWGVDGARWLLTHCSATNRERLENLLQQRGYSHQYLIVRLPRPEGDAAYFGIRFEELGARHPLVHADTSRAIRSISIFRRDKPYLVRRGGGHLVLAEKRVLLIGCGAVGGHLAFELSRAGIEQLHLVDPEDLEPENTYRHVLGRSYWGVKKAVALMRALRAQLPFSKAEAFDSTIEKVIDAGRIDLSTYDVILSAIGNPTSELALNEKVRRSVGGPPIVFTWVDPYGIGGHAVLTGLSGSAGCFECLYTGTDSAEHLHNRASFAAPGQVFRRSIAGCSSLYTPYGSLDASQTAQLAARLALDILLGRAQTNQVRSWKGDASEFTAEEFILSDRHSMSLEKLEKLGIDFASELCPICQAMQLKVRS
jgi:hypothetical protein